MKVRCLIALLLFTVTACHRQPAAKEVAPKGQPQVSDNAAFAAESITQSDETKEKDAISEKVRMALRARDYDRLEALAVQYRTNLECFPDGHVKLRYVYDGLAELDESLSDATWNTQIEEMARWSKARPASPTARVALGMAWINFAWRARGHDYASGVDNEGWKLFAARTQRAHEVLDEAAKLPDRCPIYWLAMQRVALNEGWDLPDYEKLFQKAIEQNPGLFDCYMAKINYLLPRWYGKPGDWEAFVTSAADQAKGDNGDILYARLVWYVKDLRVYELLFKEAQISWKRSSHGLNLLQARYPGSLSVTSEYCVQAGSNGEKELTQELLKQLHGRIDLSSWLDKERFESFRDWAFNK